MTAPSPITGGHRRALREQGFVHLGPVLAPEVTRELRDGLDEFATRTAAPSQYGLLCHDPRRGVELARDILASALAAPALDLLEQDQVVLFQDIFIAKPPHAAPPHADQVVQWHQDYSYWPLDSARGLTLWIALDDADPENGCLRYIPGTHTLGEKQPADFYAGAAQPLRPGLPPLTASERESEAVYAPARAGEALAHDPLVWHMSPANRSPRPRRAWSLTWITPEVRWDPEHAPHPFAYQLKPQAGERILGERFMRFARERP
jgi:ectoine hydroxylase-related dioxygenase (phytanoyl-CoA dioxygenase family)